jgi:DNA-binding NtrC family response regulator
MRVLVVDDNRDMLESMRLLLAHAGHEAETSDSAESALLIQAERPADVLITDIFMPGTDGLETIVEFRARWPRLRIVAMSGGGTVARSDYLDVAREAGADAMLRKPFEPQRLIDTLERLAKG